MNLLQLRTETLAHGFDPNQYGTRINQYLNDAQNLVARRVDYYVDETTSLFSTTSGTDTYAWPTGLARIRSLFDTNRRVELEYVSVRAMDASPNSSGAPIYYAVVTSAVRLYPVPDGIYPLEMRYWTLPATLVGDTDTPTIPADWHHMLWEYAVAQCYWADDDSTMGQSWEQKFNTTLSMFAADQKFPDSDGPSQAAGMWDSGQALGSSSVWGLYAG